MSKVDSKNRVMEYVILSCFSCFIVFYVWGIEKGINRQELEQKLCQLKQYEHCTNEELEELLKKIIK